MKYVAALRGWECPKNLPYGLDIWWNNKVLNVEWSDDGRTDVVSYKPGRWESELERICKDTMRSRTVAVEAFQ
jgi:hypothetical protein